MIGAGEKAQYLLGRKALEQTVQPEIPVTLGKTTAMGIEQERDMDIPGDRETEQTAEIDLARGRGEDVPPADDFCHPGGGVIDDHGQLIPEQTV